MSRLLYPPKCVLCGTILEHEETDLCRDCRANAPVYDERPRKLPHLAKWICLWYYKGDVRPSILRFKFHGRRSHARSYGRLLAVKLLEADVSFDILTWAPVSFSRLLKRGYDQSRLLAAALGKELGVRPLGTLRKHRPTLPQSRCRDTAARRANVLGAYRCTDEALVRGKRILLIDDILTTGATAGECARVLLMAGAKEVVLAVLATPEHHQ